MSSRKLPQAIGGISGLSFTAAAGIVFERSVLSLPQQDSHRLPMKLVRVRA